MGEQDIYVTNDMDNDAIMSWVIAPNYRNYGYPKWSNIWTGSLAEKALHALSCCGDPGLENPAKEALSELEEVRKWLREERDE